jgi:hypothetical protein
VGKGARTRSVHVGKIVAKARNRVGGWYGGSAARSISEGRATCDGYATRTTAQLKRYGPNFAKWGFHFLSAEL